MPERHRSSHVPVPASPDFVPASLRRAILSFILACAARRERGHGRRHCSMLVHVTRFTAVQSQVHRQVADALRLIRQRLQRGIGSGDLLGEMRELWDQDFAPTSVVVGLEAQDPSIRLAAWSEIAELLPDVVADIEVKTINGTAKDALDYADNAGRGLKVIAIGGDKLARGLTLEGLCVSYFHRASRMYDTLMQMGRWLGYRPGYLDLCRLYTTPDLVEWFGHIADASEELREEFDLMQATGGTPRDYGLKVQSHPVLMVTSRVKMRATCTLQVSFSGQLISTRKFYRETKLLTANLEALRTLVGRLGQPAEGPYITRNRNGARQQWEGMLWRRIRAEHVLEFLRSYAGPSSDYKFNSRLLAEFIESMTQKVELTRWSVAVLGVAEGGTIELSQDITVKRIKRWRRSREAKANMKSEDW